jgi:hypothetical protein
MKIKRKKFFLVRFGIAGLVGLQVRFCGFAKVGIKKYQTLNLVQKVIESTNVQFSTKAPFLPNPS